MMYFEWFTNRIFLFMIMFILTQKDIDEIEKIVEKSVKDNTKHLPTKDQFYLKMDELIGEIKSAREELQVHSGQHERIDDDIDELKKSKFS